MLKVSVLFFFRQLQVRGVTGNSGTRVLPCVGRVFSPGHVIVTLPEVSVLAPQNNKDSATYSVQYLTNVRTHVVCFN